MDQQQTRKPQLDDKTIRSLMPAIDISKLHLKGDLVLIYHEDQNNQETKTAGGISLTEKTLQEAKLDKLTTGVIVLTGSGIVDPDIAVGRQALFYRHDSTGGIKGLDDKIYVLFREYAIYGTLPAPILTSAIIAQA